MRRKNYIAIGLLGIVLLTTILAIMPVPARGYVGYGGIAGNVNTPAAAAASGAQVVANAKAAENNAVCFKWNKGFNIGACAKELVAWVFGIFMWFFSLILKFANMVFALTIYISIEKIGDYINLPTVTHAWTILRDLANMIFIFILLAIGLGTIVGSAKINKNLLPTVIVIALLINFSAVIPKVIIDASNVLALQVYHSMGTSNWQPFGDKTPAIPDITAKINQNMGFKTSTDEPITTTTGSLPWKVILLQPFINIIAYLLIAFCLFAASVLFLVRTVYLIFMVVLSPIAVAALAVPTQSHYFGIWLKKTFNQAIFAPIFLLLLFISISIISSPTAFNIGNVASGGASASAANAAGTALAATASDSDFAGLMFMLMQAVLAAGFLGFSIVAATSLGAAATGVAMAFGGWATYRATGAVVGATRGATRLTGRGADAASQKLIGKKPISASVSAASRLAKWTGETARRVPGANQFMESKFAQKLAGAARSPLVTASSLIAATPLGVSFFGKGAKAPREERKEIGARRAKKMENMTGTEKLAYLNSIVSKENQEAVVNALSKEDKAKLLHTAIETEGGGKKEFLSQHSPIGKDAAEFALAGGAIALIAATLNRLPTKEQQQATNEILKEIKNDDDKVAFLANMKPEDQKKAFEEMNDSQKARTIMAGEDSTDSDKQEMVKKLHKAQPVETQQKVDKIIETAREKEGNRAKIDLAIKMVDGTETLKSDGIRGAGRGIVEALEKHKELTGTEEFIQYLTGDQLGAILAKGFDGAFRQQIRETIEKAYEGEAKQVDADGKPSPIDPQLQKAHNYLNNTEAGKSYF